MPDTFAVFKQKIQDLVHPGGLALPLDYQFEQDIIEGLIKVQRWVEYYKRRNRTLASFCSSYFHCGATVVPKPRGEVQRLYTLSGGCCPIFYTHIPDYDAFTNWLNANRRKWIEPVNAGMPTLQSPFKFSEPVTDKGWRAGDGFYSFKDFQIFIGQRIESTETVVIEWRGIRRKWEADDLMPYDDASDEDEDDMGVELRNVVASFVRSEDLRKNRRDIEGSIVEMKIFDEKIAELKYDDHTAATPKAIGNLGVQKFDQLTVSGPCKSSHCIAPVVSEDTIFAIIGDYGSTDPDSVNRDAVAELVKSWGPEYIVTNGDNWYDYATDDVSLSGWELAAAAPYRNFIYPYRSYQNPKLTSNATRNNFYPCIGNHDRDPDGRLAIEIAGFNLPQVYRNGAWRPSVGYYSVVRAHVEHFFYDSGYDNSQVNQQADGNDLHSIQAVWLQTGLANSKARWKVVHIHHPGYTSTPSGGAQPTLVGDGYLDYTAIRNITNKLKEWGADLVTHGHAHNYERLDVAGFPILINGLGGRSIVATGTARIWSQFRYYAQYGAIKATVNCNSMRFDFITVDGVVQDALEISK